MPNEAQSNPRQAGASMKGTPGQAITPELVDEIADRVYAMLVREMNIERERLRRATTSVRGPGSKPWR